MNRPTVCVLVWALLAVGPGCGRSELERPPRFELVDATVDAAAVDGAARDAVTHDAMLSDAATDAGFDATIDAGFDATIDAGFDAASDAGFDATIDASEPPLRYFQEAYVKASNTGREDLFGASVAIDGETMVVGALAEDSNAQSVDGAQDNNHAESSGAAYVFVRRNGVWSQEAYLKGHNTQAYDHFGRSVAISGDTIVVGAPDEDPRDNASPYTTDQRSGAAYVFVRRHGVWSQAGYLKASNAGTGDDFGRSVAISGDVIVVGAPYERGSARQVNGPDNDDALFAGAAYVFVRSRGAWSQRAYLKASNADAEDWFGNSVSVSNGTIVVGAPNEGSAASGVDADQSDNSERGNGAAYVFVPDGDVWVQQAYLKPRQTGGPSYFDLFGSSVAITNDTIAISATGEDSDATGIDGDQLNDRARGSGAVYVFDRLSARWMQSAYVKASNTDSYDSFGSSLAVSGDRMIVGARDEDSAASGIDGDQHTESSPSSGAAYVFERNDHTWRQTAYLKASNNTSLHYAAFGTAVAASGDTFAVTAANEASNATGINGDQLNAQAIDSGAVYVFRHAAR